MIDIFAGLLNFDFCISTLYASKLYVQELNWELNEEFSVLLVECLKVIFAIINSSRCE